MGLTVRAADLGADRDLIIRTLRQYLTKHSDAARFDWLYLANPYGRAAAWVAVDEDRGETVGMASAFPRKAIRGGTEEICWVLGDFCVHEAYRTLGPAVRLNRACLSGVDQGTVAFCYDFPSRSMMAVYRRMGIRPFGEMVRFAKVLRWGMKLREAVAIPGIRTGLGLLGEIADRVPLRRAAPSGGASFRLETETCGDGFDALDRTRRGRAALYLERSAAYLNWRYRANPLERYELLTARQEGSIQGYAAFTQAGPHALIGDLSARSDETARGLLDEVCAFLKARGAATVSASVLSTHPIIPTLAAAGFRPREATPVVVYRGARGAQADPPAPLDWPLFHGDRDS